MGLIFPTFNTEIHMNHHVNCGDMHNHFMMLVHERVVLPLYSILGIPFPTICDLRRSNHNPFNFLLFQARLITT